PAKASPFGNPAVGPMVLPGTYTVRLAKRINGVVTPLSDPQTFTVKALNTSPEAADDRDALLAFQKDTADTARAIASASATSAEFRDRLAHLKVAVETLTSANDTQRGSIQQIEAILDDVDIAFQGDRTVSSRNEPAPWPISSRISQIRSWSWYNQSPTTESNKDALTIAKQEFGAALAQLRDVENRLVTLESEFEELGAPYTPGRGLPVWPIQE
ncbi:MAG: hypothetical protein AAGJ50_08945, partial [Pseudomonadota bacterium]